MKKIFIYSIFIISILLSNINLYAQADNKDIIEFYGKIVDTEGNPVSFVHVINMQKGLATISDTSGHFRMPMLKTDTLRLSSIGYEIKYFGLPKGFKAENNQDNRLIITLKPALYELGTVDVFSVRWKAFVYEYSNIDIEENETTNRIKEYIEKSLSTEELVLIANAARGIGFPINFRTQRDKSIEKMKEYILQEELNRKANEKYNRELVADITKLKGKELDNFMAYCRFDREFILRQSEYNLIVIINELFEIYKSDKNLK